MRRTLITVFFVLFILVVSSSSASGPGPKILILNSYHKGYSWSDQMISSIESTLLLAHPDADIRLEYMDTKRQSSASYFEILHTFYREKYSKQDFDLIFGCDDHAIEFLLNSAETIFPDVPIVFSGANRIDTAKILSHPNITGVLEYADIKKTIEIATRLQPEAKELLVINDTTTTGKYIGAELHHVMEQFDNDLNVEIFEGEPLEQIKSKLATCSRETIVLLLHYLRDVDGKYYEPATVAKTLSTVSPAPVYGVWDFYFNHGLTGGVMTSGYLQGGKAAEIGIKLLGGKKISDTPIVTDGANQLLFDYSQLERFNLSLDRIPHEAIIKNITFSEQKNVLLLNSYSPDNAWTSEVMRGITGTLANSAQNINSYTEYLDTKRHTDKPYLNQMVQLLHHKYDGMEIDLIITSDDNSFNLVRHHRSSLFKDIPLIFCGVNYLPNPQAVRYENITGVVESYDILETIRLGLELFPETKTLFVVNDSTTTGKSNIKRLAEIRPDLPEELNIIYSGNSSMQQLQKRVAGLDDTSLVLLMSFTMDKDNYRFSFQESARLISKSSARPVLGFWDFYLGCGIIGGVVTAGYDQGRTAGELAEFVLSGTAVEELPVVEESPVTPTLDYEVAVKFGLDMKTVPEQVRIINRPTSFFDQYREMVMTTLAIFLFLLCLILFQAARIIWEQRRRKQLAVKVEIDPMTGTNNRDYFSNNIEKIRTEALTQQTPLTLCYLDLDNLKLINDNYGHKAGDDYILLAVEAIQKHIRSEDILCRMGGDEFIALLKNCSKETGKSICRRASAYLADQQEERGVDWNGGISCGFAELDPATPVSTEELIDQADSEMYRNKLERKKQQRFPNET